MSWILLAKTFHFLIIYYININVCVCVLVYVCMYLSVRTYMAEYVNQHAYVRINRILKVA